MNTIATPSNTTGNVVNFNHTVTGSRSRAGNPKSADKGSESPLDPVDLGKFARLRYGNNEELIFNIHCQVRN
jgi:hypothetical protein